MEIWQIVLGVMVGVGLSAACGCRVFIPLLVMSIAAKAGHLTFSPGFEWIGSWIAIIAFAVATVVEIVAFCVPYIDNVLDWIALPCAIVAGTIVTAVCVSDVSPFLRWTLAVIGGGVALSVQAATMGIRGTSSVTTAGFGNIPVAAGEATASLGLSFLAVFLPIVALAVTIVLVVVLVLLARKLRRRLKRRSSSVTNVNPQAS